MADPADIFQNLRESELITVYERTCDSDCNTLAYFSHLEHQQYLASIELARTVVVVCIMVLGVAIITQDAQQLVRCCCLMATATAVACVSGKRQLHDWFLSLHRWFDPSSA